MAHVLGQRCARSIPCAAPRAAADGGGWEDAPSILKHRFLVRHCFAQIRDERDRSGENAAFVLLARTPRDLVCVCVCMYVCVIGETAREMERRGEQGREVLSPPSRQVNVNLPQPVPSADPAAC